MEVRFPVFVRMRDSGDVKKYPSIAAMQNDFERIDVENDEYEAWDAGGVRLSLSVQEPIWLRVEPQDSAKPEELEAAIVEFAQRSGVPGDPSVVNGKFEAALDAIQQKLNADRRSRRWLRRGRRGR